MSVFKLLRSYGVWGSFRLIGWLAYTKLLIREARLIRPPLYIRGRSDMSFGKGFTSGRFNRIEVFAEGDAGAPLLSFGKNVQINDSNHISAIRRVAIGDNVLIASRVFISDHNHGGFESTDPLDGPDTPPTGRPLVAKPVHIGDNVWIGEGACILPGVTIGDGAVIGAGAVVTRDVPAGCVAAGNPARVLRRYDADTSQWRRV